MVVGQLESRMPTLLMPITARINKPAHIMMMNRMVCIGSHGSKLAHHEGFQHMADPHLAKQYRPGGR